MSTPDFINSPPGFLHLKQSKKQLAMEEKQYSKEELAAIEKKNNADWHKEVLVKRFGPANKRTASVWREIVRAFGFELVRDAEGFTDDRLNKKMQTTSFSQQLKEKIRKKNLQKVNA